jgi:hypothetical protein
MFAGAGNCVPLVGLLMLIVGGALTITVTGADVLLALLPSVATAVSA